MTHLNFLKVPNDPSLVRLQSPSRVVQSAGGGGGIAFKLNGGMDAAAMADMTRTTSGESGRVKMDGTTKYLRIYQIV